MSALAAKHPHVPVRASKLTMVLESYLRRGARLSLLVCLSPSARHLCESAASLEFARRALQVVLTPPAPPRRPPPELPPPPSPDALFTPQPSSLPTAHAIGIRHVRSPRTTPLPSTAKATATEAEADTELDADAASEAATETATAFGTAAAAAVNAAVDAAVDAAAAANTAAKAQRAVVQEEVRREVAEVRRDVRREVRREVSLLDAEREERHGLELGLLRQLLKVHSPSGLTLKGRRAA